MTNNLHKTRPISISPSARSVGVWSAALTTCFSVAYVIAQLAEWAGMLGSEGGPSSESTVVGIIFLLTPSLLLASSFLVLTISIHQLAAPGRAIWSQIAVAFATAYAVLVSAVYFVQLTFVAPHLARGAVAGIEPFLFVPFDSFLYAVDILGYSFMSVATLFAAPALTGSGLQRRARVLLIANGLLLPFIALQMYFHWMIWVASAWAITFPGAAGTLTLLFWKLATAAASTTTSSTESKHDYDHLLGINQARRRHAG